MMFVCHLQAGCFRIPLFYCVPYSRRNGKSEGVMSRQAIPLSMGRELYGYFTVDDDI